MSAAKLPRDHRSLGDVLQAIKDDGKVSTIDRMRHNWLRQKIAMGMVLGYLERAHDLQSDACIYRLTEAGESRLQQHTRVKT